MASQLKVDTITGVTTAGSIAVTGEGNSTTTNLQQGLAKQWVHTTGVGTPTLADSFNTASVTDENTGAFGYSFTNNMSNANYSTSGFVHLGGVIACIQQVADSGIAQTTALVGARTHTTSAAVDADQSVSVLGDLA